MTMRTLLLCLLTTAVTVTAQAPRPPAPAATADPTFYSVAYIEVKSSARVTAIQQLKWYRDSIRANSASLRTEIFEQVDRPGHLLLVETWQSQAAFDAGTPAIRKKLTDAIEPSRLSGWDVRPYRTLSVASGAAEATGRSVFVISHVDVTPDPKIAAMLKDLAEKSRLEDGNVRFDVLAHTMRSNHFEVIETWSNQRALDNHAAAAHTRQYRDDVQPMLGSPLDERIYKAVE
jgi:quinol monooxygenase YgiN